LVIYLMVIGVVVWVLNMMAMITKHASFAEAAAKSDACRDGLGPPRGTHRLQG
jgi:hypothetical protein